MALSWRIKMLGELRIERFQSLEMDKASTVAVDVLDHIGSRQEGTLLAFLSYFPRAHSREELIELLWPGRDAQLSRNHLRVVLSALRRDLGSADVPAHSTLITDRRFVRLNRGLVSTDVTEFEDALRGAVQAPDWTVQSRHLTRAVELYGGILLPGFYDDWILPEAQRLEECFFTALRRLISKLERTGDFEAALHFARHGASMNASREDIARDLMRLYGATNQPSLARRQYHELESALQRSLSTAPCLQTRELLSRIEREAFMLAPLLPTQASLSLTSTESATPTLNSPQEVDMTLPNPPGNTEGTRLPSQWTRFVGRATEIAEVQELLHNGTRLVTLTGTGGTGKTRLAVEVAQLLINEWEERRNALWFVTLANVTDARLVAGEIVDAMRLPRAPASTLLVQVTQALGARVKPLLILDNFEHLLPEGVSLVQELLSRVPQLQLLITSRRELGIVGERSFWVPPLRVPHPNLSPQELLRVESVQLFHDRVRATQPKFRITKHNAPSVAKLCGHLEGLPLAIELCATRAGEFSPSKMLTRLEHRFEFPSQDSTYPHPTLRAALDWSYTLLWPELQKFFAQLCVFRGGCSPDAASTIAQEPHAAHMLHQLRMASLVTSHEVRGQTRFFLLETVREWVSEKLSPEEERELRQRHTEYYMAQGQSAEPHLLGPHQGQWLDKLEIEIDNLRVALVWASHNAPSLNFQMVGALSRFWLVRGYYAEGRQWIESVLQHREATSFEPTSHLKMLGMAAELAWYSGDFAEAFSLNERRLNMANASGDTRAVAGALNSLGYAAAQMGDYERAESLLEQSLDLSRKANDNALLSEVLLNAAGEASTVGNFTRVRLLGEEGIQLSQQSGDTRQRAFLFNITGFAALLEGDLGRAKPLLEESLTLSEDVGEKWHTNRVWWTLGHLARREGDHALALARFDRALSELREWGCFWPLPYHLEPRAYMEIEEKKYERAARLLGAAQGLRDGMRHTMHPVLVPEYQFYLRAVRENLDAATMETEWNTGHALSWDEATILALSKSA